MIDNTWGIIKKRLHEILKEQDLELIRKIDEAIDNGDSTLRLFGKSIKRTKVDNFTFYHLYEPCEEHFTTVVYYNDELKGID